MNRRTFFGWMRDEISSSFLVGCGGGLAAGGVGVAVVLHDPDNRSVARSYSQQGEDLIVDSICGFLKVEKPTYLDVGAADPSGDNNTYLFYRKGCRGVLVEPNPALCRRLREVRPKDTLLNIGIGTTDQAQADYYVMSGAWLNTFSKEQAERVVSSPGSMNRIEKVLKMPLVNINKIIHEHFQGAPDFVSIDTEGLDFDILKSLDFERFRPKIICVETLVVYTTKEDPRIRELMHSKGYTVRGSTFVNTIFVDNRLL